MAIKKNELYSSLWASCDKLRGGMDASQYKDYILTLLFVKYVTDKFKGVKYADITVPRKDAFESYRSISPKWGAVGILAIVTSLVGLAYYTVLGGWVLHYILASVTGLTAPEADAAAHFSAFTADAAA